VRQLREAGHQVVGTTRSDERAEGIRAAGAEPAIIDVLDTEALRKAVAEAQPEVVINELTALPDRPRYRDPEAFRATNELRGRVGPALAGVASEAGARRLISQSICFFYAPTGAGLRTEEDPILELPPDTPAAEGMVAIGALEGATLQTPGLEGVVLRYGFFYGPGTYYAPDGTTTADVRRRRFPIVGKGTGVFSFLHVEDAASATVAAIKGPPGVYNVCDDEPAPMSEWLPAYAEAIGGKPPWRVPVWLVRLVAGKQAAQMATVLEGASNAKAKRELDWRPKYPSWRQGFREGLG